MCHGSCNHLSEPERAGAVAGPTGGRHHGGLQETLLRVVLHRAAEASVAELRLTARF